MFRDQADVVRGQKTVESVGLHKYERGRVQRAIRLFEIRLGLK